MSKKKKHPREWIFFAHKKNRIFSFSDYQNWASLAVRIPPSWHNFIEILLGQKLVPGVCSSLESQIFIEQYDDLKKETNSGKHQRSYWLIFFGTFSHKCHLQVVSANLFVSLNVTFRCPAKMIYKSISEWIKSRSI